MENDISLNDASPFIVFIAFFSMILFALSILFFYFNNLEIRNVLLINSVLFLGLAIFGEWAIIFRRSEN